ncbi:unnamed protein product [Calypogeia fissa]
MSSGSEGSKDSPNREKVIDMPPPKKKKSTEIEAGQQSGESSIQMTIRELSDQIYKREDICIEEPQTKRKWYLRDARIRDQEGIFQKPCLWLEVIPAAKKEPLQYGAVITACLEAISIKKDPEVVL